MEFCYIAQIRIGLLMPIFRIVECICADHSPRNTPNDPWIKFLNHPCSAIFGQNRIGCLEPVHSSFRKSEFWIISGMAKHKDKTDTR